MHQKLALIPPGLAQTEREAECEVIKGVIPVRGDVAIISRAPRL